MKVSSRMQLMRLAFNNLQSTHVHRIESSTFFIAHPIQQKLLEEINRIAMTSITTEITHHVMQGETDTVDALVIQQSLSHRRYKQEVNR